MLRKESSVTAVLIKKEGLHCVILHVGIAGIKKQYYARLWQTVYRVS